MKIVLHGRITAKGSEAHRKWVSGTGADAIFEDLPPIHYVVISNTIRIRELLEHTDYEIGDKVTLTLEKENPNVETDRKDAGTPHDGPAPSSGPLKVPPPE